MYWPVDEGTNFEDPHIKTYLLLQSFMLRLPLPVADFVNDQSSVLDNSIRLINALADIAGELKLSNQLRLIFTTMPLLIQAIMPYDSEFLQLDGMDNSIMKRLKNEGYRKLKDFRNHSESELMDVMMKCRLDSNLASKVRFGFRFHA